MNVQNAAGNCQEIDLAAGAIDGTGVKIGKRDLELVSLEGYLSELMEHTPH